jgi:hypothetical protein
MKHFAPLDITLTDSSIAEDEGINGTIYPFVLIEAYDEGVQRYYGTRLWEARADINPLANFEWKDIDPLDSYATNLHTQTVEADPSAVSVIVGTKVYEHSTKKYYSSLAIATVDFTAGDLANPAKFTDLGTTASYRYLYKIPEENSIYWKDLGATNRNKCVDKAVNSQSEQTGTEMWFEFEVKNIDKVILFNLDAKSSTIILYDPLVGIGSPVYEDTKDDLLNTTSIINWRTLSQYEPILISNVDWTLPFFSGTLTVRIILENTVSSLLKLGEILVGQNQQLGLTLDGVPITIKSSGKITQQENGDIVFEDEGDITKVYRVFNFVVLFDSVALDTTLDQCDAMINKRIVVFGENTDEEQYRSLIVYGFSRDASPAFKSNATKSDIKFQVQRLL